jgi:alpha,alpha-trehalose-phosphate synthase [UDP-forming]
MTLSNTRRLVIVSNRLPVVLTKTDDQQWHVEPGDGGLVNALAPILRDRGGVWVGWPGTVSEDEIDLEPLLAEATSEAGYVLAPVALTASERDKFYLGFTNEIIWPLFHDLQSRCNFDPSYWAAYESVNHTFAQAIMRTAQDDDYIWVHDYHLMSVARELRAIGIRSPVGFFLHIPFPAPDIFLKLPWREQILEALLAYDLIGFQTERDQHNFVQCVGKLFPDIELRDQGRLVLAHVGGRTVRIGNFPISIDFTAIEQQAAAAAIKQRAMDIRARLPSLKLILGVDRLDYTKGIPERLEAFRNALTRYPELHERVVLTQVVVPSRTAIREYHALKVRIERLVSEINGQFTQAGWVPIHYIHRRLDWAQLLAYYRTADIALITPLKDGMNLVAKEYCAASLEDGVLILSEFAGAAVQLQHDALLVNPYDVEEAADAIYQAWAMHPEERRRCMQRLRRTIREHDIFWWVNAFLHAGQVAQRDQRPHLGGGRRPRAPQLSSEWRC